MAKDAVKKRLLIVAQHFWPEDFRINDIADGFVQNDVEVDVLCGIPNYPKGRFYPGYSTFKNRRQSKDGIEIFRALEIPRGSSSLGIFLNYVSYPFFSLFTMVRLCGRRYDSILCYETSPVLMIFPAIVISKIKRAPLYSYVLDLWPENLYSVLPIKNKLLRAVASGVSAWHYRHGGHLIALSSGMKERLLDITGRNDIAVFPQYCEDIYAENSSPKGNRGKVFNIMFAGNFSPAQGLDMLIELAKLCRDEGIKEVKFSMYGDGMSHADFVFDVEKNRLLEYFDFFGRVSIEDVIIASNDADALFVSLNTSADLDLTVPAKVSSCMAMCRPLLCALSGAGAATIEEAGCGYCSRPGDVDELFDNLKQLLSLSEGQLNKLSHNAKDYYEKYLSRDAVLPELIRHIIGKQ